MKRWILFILILLGTPEMCCCETQTYCDGDFKYIVTDNAAVITGWDNWDESEVEAILVVPCSLGGYPVTGIGSNVFSTCTTGPSAEFSIYIPEGITFLNPDAFQCCDSASTIFLPSSLEQIPEGCFTHVDAEIVFPNGNPYFISMDGYLIDSRTNTLLYTANSSKHSSIPQVSRLGSRCLDNWIDADDDVKVILPQSINSIGSRVFYDYPNLLSICFSNQVSSIDSMAFYCCGFSEIKLPSSLLIIPSYCFVDCYLDSVIISEGTQRIGEYAFYWNRGELTEVVLPLSVEWVGYNAFPEGCIISALNRNTHFESLEEYQLREPNGEW